MNEEEIMDILDGWGYRHERQNDLYKIYVYKKDIETMKTETGLTFDILEIHEGPYRFNNFILTHIDEDEG